MSSIPLNRALEHKCNGADDGTNYDHWVKPDDSALKKVFETEAELKCQKFSILHL